MQKRRRKEKGSIFIRHFFTDRSEDRSFYQEHFGILEVEETMILDKGTFNIEAEVIGMKAAGTDTMKNEIKYEKSELELMTTYQLRKSAVVKNHERCHTPLDKEELIQTIMRYMGKRQDFFICDRKKGGEERVEEFLKIPGL